MLTGTLSWSSTYIQAPVGHKRGEPRGAREAAGVGKGQAGSQVPRKRLEPPVAEGRRQQMHGVLRGIFVKEGDNKDVVLASLS